ncbi:hypothetical protein EVAR_15082_1 [Eumeta japonica]|uniref:Uncharacterized protein n=1 Tax=Eumeta variegata TaxID=151549 RepID=A0A4C1YL54_EUMVA|nr:hypothetical protein EVAR_15082_1 [Eumeta japonica]
MSSLPNGLHLFRFVDIRVREAAWLYEEKRSKHMEDIYVDWELENPVDFCKFLYPAHVTKFGFKSVEDLDPTKMERLAIVGSHIYIEGSRTEGKVGVALKGWVGGFSPGNPHIDSSRLARYSRQKCSPCMGE